MQIQPEHNGCCCTRSLFFTKAHFQVKLWAKHVARVQNVVQHRMNISLELLALKTRGCCSHAGLTLVSFPCMTQLDIPEVHLVTLEAFLGFPNAMSYDKGVCLQV